MFHGQYRALMQYAVPRESSETHGDMNDVSIFLLQLKFIKKRDFL